MAEPDPKPDQPDQPRADDSHPASSETPQAEPDLIAEVSPEAKETVLEFMAEAAQQNEAANEAVAAGGDGAESGGQLSRGEGKPGPYIAFEHVYKSFGTWSCSMTSASPCCRVKPSASWDAPAWANRSRCRS
jgi:hypothetical protein